MNYTELKNIQENILDEYYIDKNNMEFLCKKYNANWSDIFKIICLKFRPTGDTSEDENKEMCSLYLQDVSGPIICEKFKIRPKNLYSILRDNNIEIRDGKNKKYKVDEHYFDYIDTPNKAYILGFLYADGCNMVNRYSVSLRLREDDKEILQKMKDEINSTRPLRYIPEYYDKKKWVYK